MEELNVLFDHYMTCFNRSLVIEQVGHYQYTVTSHSRKDEKHSVHYDGTGLPLCSCEAKGACSHTAGVVAYVFPTIQDEWDRLRIFKAKERSLLIAQGKTNPRRHPKIRKAMANIEERFPRAPLEPKCTNCGAALKVQDKELCLKCRQNLSEIWPGCPEFAAELEAVDQDEAMRLKLGMGE